MKTRVFYMVHLDSSRIFFLLFTLLGLLLFSFTLGHQFGKDQYHGQEESQKIQDFPLFSLKKAKKINSEESFEESKKGEKESEGQAASAKQELVLLESKEIRTPGDVHPSSLSQATPNSDSKKKPSSPKNKELKKSSAKNLIAQSHVGRKENKEI